MKLLHELVEERAAKHGPNNCIVFDLGLDISYHVINEHKITYEELAHQIHEFRDVFTNLQVHNKIVAVCLLDCLEMPSILLGLLSCECAFHPINFEDAKYSVQALSSSGASWIVMHTVYFEKLKSLIESLNGLEIVSDILNKYQLKIFHLRKLSSLSHLPNLAYCITTSGTTGYPKVVKVPHSCIVPNIIHLSDIFSLGPADKVLLTSPLTFDPSIVDIFCTLSSGACLIIVPQELKRRPDQLLHVIHTRQNISFMQATPSFMRTFSSSKLQKTLLGLSSPLRILALGGEAFPEISEVMSWVHQGNKKTKLYNLYGVTEISCWATYHQVDIQNGLYLRGTCTASVPLGKPLDKTLIKLVPHHSEDEGEIWLGSSERACYVSNERSDIDNASFWRNTGDCGRLTSSGDIIFLHRIDDQVKRMGKRLNLTAIEKVLRLVPGVVNCSVQLDGYQLLAFIVTDTELLQTSLSQAQIAKTFIDWSANDQSFGEYYNVQWSKFKLSLMKNLEDSLPRHYMPDSFIHVKDGLPITTSGKLDKKKLFALAEKETKHLVISSLENPLKLAQTLWLSVLPMKDRDIHRSDNFISLGGDSLGAVRLVNIIESVYGDKLTNLFDILVNRDFRLFVDHLTQYLSNKVPHCGPASSENSVEIISSSGENNSHSEILHQENSDLGLKSKKQKLSHSCDLKNTFCVSDFIVKKTISRGSNFMDRCHLQPSNVLKEVICSSIDKSFRLTDGHKQINMETKWKFNTRKCVDASPLIVDYMDITLAFIGSHSGLFCAINVNNGQSVWEVTLPDRIESSACTDVKCGYIIVGCYDGVIYVLNARDGHTEWLYATQGMVKCCPILNPKTGHIICGSHDGHLYCLDVEQKNCVWKQNLGGGSVFSSPAIDLTHGYVFAATLAGRVVGLFYDTGNINWIVQLNKPVFSSLCICDGSVLVGCVDGHLYCLNPLGDSIWKYKAEAPIFSTPVVSTSYIFIGCHDAYLYCLSKDGHLIWRFKTLSTVYATAFFESTSNISVTDNIYNTLPVVVNSCDVKEVGKKQKEQACLQNNSLLLTADSKGTLYLICPDCGLLLCQVILPGEIFSSPVKINSQVLVGCRDNYLYCFSIT